MGEKWFEFVKRIHKEGQQKNAKYLFKEAMADASKRKSEWNKDGKPSVSNEPTKKMRKSRKSKKNPHMKSKKTRKSRKSKKNIKA